jgi:hypothetical protein
MRNGLGRKCMLCVFLAPAAWASPANAQELPTTSQSSPVPQTPEAAQPAPATQLVTPAAPQEEKIILPAGTHLSLVLNNGINTRTAKAGDAVYFQTVYPIAQNNRMVIPMGTFVRGQIVEAKRPGLVKGRGEFRMVLDQITFPNGYTIALLATPNSADTNGKAGVDSEGKIKGPGNTKGDVGILLATSVGGAYIGTLVGAINSNVPGKGAAIGGGAGLLVGLVAVLLTRGPEAELQRGTTLDVIFDKPLVLDSSLLPINGPGEYFPPAIPAALEYDGRRRNRPLHPPFIPFFRF